MSADQVLTAEERAFVVLLTKNGRARLTIERLAAEVATLRKVKDAALVDLGIYSRWLESARTWLQAKAYEELAVMFDGLRLALGEATREDSQNAGV